MSANDLSDKFRLNASLLFQESCPEQSRFFLRKHFVCLGQKGQESPAALDETSFCTHCFQWLRPDNQRARLRPKRRPSARVQRLLRRRAEGKALGPLQKGLLQRFWTSSSVLMATCHTCSKTSRHKGMNREFLSTFPTPGSAGKLKTPPSANRSTPRKTPGKDKTPHRTPGSSTSSGTPSSNTSISSTPAGTKTPSRAKNWVVQRLSKILMREDKPVSKKVSLKDFLCSL